MADTAPMVPTMKYWNTLFPVSPPLDRYLANEGIDVVFWLDPIPLKGESKDDDPDTAATLRRCWTTEAEARMAEGSCCRAQLRARAPAVFVRAGMARSVGWRINWCCWRSLSLRRFGCCEARKMLWLSARVFPARWNQPSHLFSEWLRAKHQHPFLWFTL